MEQCPQCGQAVEKELFCRTCGHPLVDGGQPAPADKRPRAKKSHLVVMLMAFVVVGVGSLMLVASARRAPAPTSDATHSAATRLESPQAQNNATVATASPASRSAEWVVREPNYRLRMAGTGVAFELSADSEVDVWRKRVRPVLTVRCSGKDTEVFVVTHSPASIEDNTRLHRVTVAFDGGQSAPARWEHSVDHDALFASNGDEMARQIASASTMTFTFTPFNAPDTSVHFSVAGLDAHLDTNAKGCARKK